MKVNDIVQEVWAEEKFKGTVTRVIDDFYIMVLFEGQEKERKTLKTDVRVIAESRFLVVRDKTDGQTGYMETVWTDEDLSFKWTILSEHKTKDEAHLAHLEMKGNYTVEFTDEEDSKRGVRVIGHTDDKLIYTGNDHRIGHDLTRIDGTTLRLVGRGKISRAELPKLEDEEDSIIVVGEPSEGILKAIEHLNKKEGKKVILVGSDMHLGSTCTTKEAIQSQLMKTEMEIKQLTPAYYDFDGDGGSARRDRRKKEKKPKYRNKKL